MTRAPLLALLLALPAAAGTTARVSRSAGQATTVPSLTLPVAPVVAGLGAPGAAVPSLAPALPSPAALTPSLVSAVEANAVSASPVSPDAVQAPFLAASAPEKSPGPDAARAEAAEPNAPSFKRRILDMLARMSNPFGGKKAEEAPPASEAERLDRAFDQNALWAEIAPSVRAEIEGLRARKTKKAALRAYAEAEAAAALERIKAARGVANIGFHFNLHGGRREDYVGTGIRATMGDIALNYSTHGDRNMKVYFFQSARHGLFAPLHEKNPQIMFFDSRMGHALNLFDLDAPALAEARADGRIKNFGDISMDFHGMNGVPYSAYLAPPLDAFIGTGKKVGLRLSRDEETLATIRFVEAALTRGGSFVPGGRAAHASAEAAAAAARARAAAAASPAGRIIPQFPLRDGEFYYHGTTFDDLARAVAGGGTMAGGGVSQFSQRAADSLGYAAERKRKVGGTDNPEVLLQFRVADLSPLVSGDLYRAALAATDRGMPPLHAAYAAAEKPVPLSLMTPASKRTLLAWLEARGDARLAAFEAALKP